MNEKALTVGDLMVRRPVFLETWNTLDEARALFMDNAFTALPVRRSREGQEEWRLLTDAWLAIELLRDRVATKKKTLGQVFEQLEDAVDVAPTDKLAKLVDKKAPLFLVMEKQRLLGVITPSDLL